MAIIGFLNRAKETTATTGTGTVTLSGTAVSTFQTWSNASATDAFQYPYLIEDGASTEWGIGTYTASGTTFSRDTVTGSIIAGVSGTSKINLSGSATVACAPRAQDFSRQLLVEVTTSGSQASQTFSSIPSGYRDLEVRIRGRLLDSSQDAAVTIQFNSDTGSNYDFVNSYLTQSGIGQDSGTSQTTASAGHLPGNTATANLAGTIIVDIPMYANTSWLKSAGGRTTNDISGSSPGIRSMVTSSLWHSTSAINTIKLIGGASGFANGSIISLYGLF